MHVYSDESGGSDRACEQFVVSAVLIAPDAATRLMRQFRKKATPRMNGEIKGHQLSAAQRALFFRLLAGVGDVYAVAAVSSRCDGLGGWAMCNLPEHELWKELLAQAIGALPSGQATGVTVDRGRYSKETLARECREVAGRVAPIIGRGTAIRIGGSDVTPGLQVADIVANTVYHRHGGERDLATELLAAAGIRVLPLSMLERAPRWLQPA